MILLSFFQKRAASICTFLLSFLFLAGCGRSQIEVPKFSSENPLVMILLGPPGTGKGTQAAMLSEKLSLPHISTGDLFRENIQKGTPLGKQVKTYLDSGLLVPDSLVLDMLFTRIKESDCAKGYILDGFPRTLPQAEALQSFLGETIAPLVIYLSLSDAKILERLTNRVVCSQCGQPYHLLYDPPKKPGVCDRCQGALIQRPDDTKEVITKRLQVYHTETAPLIEFYEKQGLLHRIDCEASKEKVLEQILQVCNARSP